MSLRFSVVTRVPSWIRYSLVLQLGQKQKQLPPIALFVTCCRAPLFFCCSAPSSSSSSVVWCLSQPIRRNSNPKSSNLSGPFMSSARSVCGCCSTLLAITDVSLKQPPMAATPLGIYRLCLANPDGTEVSLFRLLAFFFFLFGGSVHDDDVVCRLLGWSTVHTIRTSYVTDKPREEGGSHSRFCFCLRVDYIYR